MTKYKYIKAKAIVGAVDPAKAETGNYAKYKGLLTLIDDFAQKSIDEFNTYQEKFELKEKS